MCSGELSMMKEKKWCRRLVIAASCVFFIFILAMWCTRALSVVRCPLFLSLSWSVNHTKSEQQRKKSIIFFPLRSQRRIFSYCCYCCWGRSVRALISSCASPFRLGSFALLWALLFFVWFFFCFSICNRRLLMFVMSGPLVCFADIFVSPFRRYIWWWRLCDECCIHFALHVYNILILIYFVGRERIVWQLIKRCTP